ncbi:MAG: DUF3768 domain-containing protein [Rhizomicrobium sp.]
MSEDKAKTTAALNDLFRLNFFVPSFGPRPVPGRVVCTQGISSLPPETQIHIWGKVSNFNDFTEDDIYGEHDFGAFRMPGVPEKILWKIDYYADKSCTFGSGYPSEPAQCFRVLTIMLASEY